MHIPIEVASLYKVLPAQTIEISHNWTFASAQPGPPKTLVEKTSFYDVVIPANPQCRRIDLPYGSGRGYTQVFVSIGRSTGQRSMDRELLNRANAIRQQITQLRDSL